MNEKITLAVCLTDFFRIHLFLPVLGGTDGYEMVVQPLQGVIHVAVLINTPVLPTKVFLEHFFSIKQ